VAAVDMSVATPSTAYSFTIDLGANMSEIAAGVQYFPNFKQSVYLLGARFWRSHNGSVYTTLYTISAWV
jgi:hypothetical protein